MSSSSCQGTELCHRTLMSDPPQCCICLDDLSGPATLPCRHSFCLGCIGEYWRVRGCFVCPLCKTSFATRPQLQQTRLGASAEAASPLRAGQVPCDACRPTERSAVKSCLQCMASYCAAHLEPHYVDEGFGRHVLLSVVKNLEESACSLHGRRLSRFCRSDQTCICSVCERDEHRGHRVICINREAAKKKVKCGKGCERVTIAQLCPKLNAPGVMSQRAPIGLR